MRDEKTDGVDIDRFLRDAKQISGELEMRRVVERSGVQIIPANFYSSIPSLDDLDVAFDAPAGVRRPVYSEIFDRDHLEAMVRRLAVYGRDLQAPEVDDENSPQGYFWQNSQLPPADAAAYYAMLRLVKPQTVVEIGAGFSTLVADMALRANGFGSIVAIEPFPRPFLRGIGTVRDVIEKPVQSFDRSAIAELLDDGDVLFIDSTHTVKAGSDCLYIYLHLLPALQKRIMVHSHDIFLPFPMPVEWAVHQQIYWTEQYLLYAYLLHNPAATVVYGTTYAESFLPEQTRMLVPEHKPLGGGSLWYEINGSGDKTRL